MVFGGERDKGIRLNGMSPEVVRLGDGMTEEDLLVHDAHCADPTLAFVLSRMRHPRFPEPCGVLRAVDAPVYAGAWSHEGPTPAAPAADDDLARLFESGDTWEVS